MLREGPAPGVLHKDAVRESAVGTRRILLDLRLDLGLQVDAGHRREAEKEQRHVCQLLADGAALLAPGIERLRDLALQQNSRGTSVVLKPLATLFSQASFWAPLMSNFPPAVALA